MLDEFADSSEVNTGRILKEDQIYGQHRRRKRFMQAAAGYGEDTAAADYSDYDGELGDEYGDYGEVIGGGNADYGDLGEIFESFDFYGGEDGIYGADADAVYGGGYGDYGS